jgi:hypothetical protein
VSRDERELHEVVYSLREVVLGLREDAETLELRHNVTAQRIEGPHMYLRPRRCPRFTILGRESHFEFSGVRALRTLAEEYSDLEKPTRHVSTLRPFFLLVERKNGHVTAVCLSRLPPAGTRRTRRLPRSRERDSVAEDDRR